MARSAQKAAPEAPPKEKKINPKKLEEAKKREELAEKVIPRCSRPAERATGHAPAPGPSYIPLTPPPPRSKPRLVQVPRPAGMAVGTGFVSCPYLHPAHRISTERVKQVAKGGTPAFLCHFRSASKCMPPTAKGLLFTGSFWTPLPTAGHHTSLLTLWPQLRGTQLHMPRYHPPTTGPSSVFVAERAAAAAACRPEVVSLSYVVRISECQGVKRLCRGTVACGIRWVIDIVMRIVIIHSTT